MILLSILLAILVTLSGLALIPVDAGGLEARAQPAVTYQEAMARGQDWIALDGPNVNPACRTRLQTHGQKTPRAIVLFHGFTNCPAQYSQLGQLLFDQGFNVYVPRVPYHGLQDRLSEDLKFLTARQLADTVDRAVDVAHGLGERVTVMGLSMGGAMSAWAAQHRPDVDLSISIAASFAPVGVPFESQDLLYRLMLRIPSLWLWWDESAQANGPGPQYAYPRYPTNALGEVFRLGLNVRQSALANAPAAGRILSVTNGADPAVDNATIEVLERSWLERGARLERYRFDARERFLHDLIDPNQVGQRVQEVYPVLLSLLGR